MSSDARITPGVVYRAVLLAFALIVAGLIFQVLATLILAVLIVIVLAYPGEGVSWYWLLAIPALALQTMFNAGIGLFAARVGARVNDFAQLLPFLMRTWLYASGVIFSLQQFVVQHSRNYGWVTTLLQLNPAYIFITLVRNCLLSVQRASAFGSRPASTAKCLAWANGHGAAVNSGYCPPTFVSSHLWQLAAAWAVVALLGGFAFFWGKEVFYGRG
jgi:teichoic acid transport system permease protein